MRIGHIDHEPSEWRTTYTVLYETAMTTDQRDLYSKDKRT